MILQALYDYYQRKAASDVSSVAPEGLEKKEIPFVIVIDAEGNLNSIQSTKQIDGRKKSFKEFLVPKSAKKSSGIVSNLLWENAEYALGIHKDSKSVARHQAFIDKINTELSHVQNNYELEALKKFLTNNPVAQLEKYSDQEVVNEIKNTSPNIVFKVIGSEFDSICSALRSYVKTEISSIDSAFCLITGNKEPIARLHSAIKGVRNAQTAGAALVSFNSDAYCSYGKKQNFNAQVSEKAAETYTKALNMLLARDSKSKANTGDSTVVFWADKQTEFENEFSQFFDEKETDDPDRNSRAVKNLYNSLHTGKFNDQEENRFYLLGLAPNAARIAVRFWKMGTVKDFAEKIKLHFDDLEIVKGEKDKDYFALGQLLRTTALEYKNENIPPNLAGDMVRAIIEGLPYPAMLLNNCINRIRAERHITRIRAAILKAYLNRQIRFYNKQEKELLMSLDYENTSQGYRLGRLFAVLEKIQEEAQPGINATIRDRFYSSASSCPSSVFPLLLRLKNAHLVKLNPGNKTNKEKEIGEIMDGLNPIMPAHLNLNEQATFAVGYYHQRQSFFAKKETVKTEVQQNDLFSVNK